VSRREPEKGISLSERLVSAALAALFGAIAGAMGAWLLALSFSGFSTAITGVSYPTWAVVGAAVCGIVGLVFGRSAGTFIGHVFSGVFTFTRWDNWTPPWWLWVIVLAGIAFAVFA
jgi:hypothetical protein